MSLTQEHFDLAIVGAGPAGTAAAIYALTHGLKVALIESFQKTKPQPGESLPPGVESIFRQLNIWDKISEKNLIRNSGHYTWDCHSEKLFHPYGADEQGAWQSIQIPREMLDFILLERAQALGVTLFNQCHIKNVILKNRKIEALTNENIRIQASYYIDATGHSKLFARNLRIKYIQHSPRLIAHYGYMKNNCPHQETLPIFIKNNEGWHWYTQIDNILYAWVHVLKYPFEKKYNKKNTPSRGADVTWRIASQLTGSNFFLVGDAACLLDPAAGNGVLRALMTGIMASYTILKIKKNHFNAKKARQLYTHWVKNWFESDVAELKNRKLFSDTEV